MSQLVSTVNRFKIENAMQGERVFMARCHRNYSLNGHRCPCRLAANHLAAACADPGPDSADAGGTPNRPAQKIRTRFPWACLARPSLASEPGPLSQTNAELEALNAQSGGGSGVGALAPGAGSEAFAAERGGTGGAAGFKRLEAQSALEGGVANPARAASRAPSPRTRSGGPRSATQSGSSAFMLPAGGLRCAVGVPCASPPPPKLAAAGDAVRRSQPSSNKAPFSSEGLALPRGAGRGAVRASTSATAMAPGPTPRATNDVGAARAVAVRALPASRSRPAVTGGTAAEGMAAGGTGIRAEMDQGLARARRLPPVRFSENPFPDAETSTDSTTATSTTLASSTAATPQALSRPALASSARALAPGGAEQKTETVQARVAGRCGRPRCMKGLDYTKVWVVIAG